MKAIISVIGRDRVGIVANLSDELYKLNINIIDITQTIMGEFFTMMLIVDLIDCNVPFEDAKNDLVKRGKSIGMDVRVQREEIFNSMHKI